MLSSMNQFACSIVRCFRTKTKHTSIPTHDYDFVAPAKIIQPVSDYDELAYITKPTTCNELLHSTKEFPELKYERIKLRRLYFNSLRDVDAFKKSTGFGNILYTSACYKKSLKEYELAKLHLTQQLTQQLEIAQQARIYNLAPKKEEYVDYDTMLKRRSYLEQIKAHIFASNKKKTLEIANFLTRVELLQALVYLEEINAKTPKNKTRPILREEIIKIIKSKPY